MTTCRESLYTLEQYDYLLADASHRRYDFFLFSMIYRLKWYSETCVTISEKGVRRVIHVSVSVQTDPEAESRGRPVAGRFFEVIS